MVDMSQIANALGGVGAALQGRGLEFAQQQNDQRRQAAADEQNTRLFGAQMREKDQEFEANRQKTQFTDAAAALSLFEQGNIEGVVNLGRNRKENLTKLGVEDTSTTDQYLSLAEMCQSGNKEACERLGTSLKGSVDLGVSLKILDAPPKPERLSSKDVIDGQTVTVDPVTGQATATPIENFAQSKGKTEDRGLRREELTIKRMVAETNRIANELRRETNELKRDELKKKLETQARDVAFNADSALQSAQDTIDTTGRLLGKGSGLAEAAGVSSVFPTVPGSKSANFEATLDTLQSQAFLTQVEKMKGLGALSENEGKKLAQAIGALNLSMSDRRLKGEIERIRSSLIDAKGRLEKKFGRSEQPAAETDQTNITTQAQFDALPSGALFIEDGKQYRKP